MNGAKTLLMAMCMTPLAVFGLQTEWGAWPFEEPGRYRNFYRYIRGGWFPMEIATLAAGILSLRYSKIPFAMAPIALTLWFMSMDIVPVIAGTDYRYDLRQKVSIVFGLCMTIAAFWFDRRSRIDYAKWLYIFGVMTLWGGLTLLSSSSELSKLIYCLINVGFLFTGPAGTKSVRSAGRSRILRLSWPSVLDCRCEVVRVSVGVDRPGTFGPVFRLDLP